MHSPHNGGPQRRIGEVLLLEGMISDEQLEEALEIQKTDRRTLGRILLSLGYVSYDDLARALALHLNIEYVSLSEVEVKPEVLGIISEDVLVQHKAVPLRIDNGRLAVAMADPNDVYARSMLTLSTGYPITPVIAAEDAVLRVQRRFFENGSLADGAVEGATGITARAERVEPGAQPEVDLGEPVAEPEEDGRSAHGRRAGVKGTIGDILVSGGLISEEQLNQALELQKRYPRELGKILLSLGFVTPAELARNLAQRLKLDFVVIGELSQEEVDPEALNLFGEETLRRYKALPLRFEGENLVVAMSEPNDIFALEDLSIIAGRKITPVVATQEDLEGALVYLFEAAPEETSLETIKDEVPEPEEEPDGYESPVDEGPVNGDGGDGMVFEETAQTGEVPEEAGPEDGSGGNGSLVPVEGPSSRKIAVSGVGIGAILVARGTISEMQLEQAFMLQQDDPREVSKILLSLGYIQKADLAQALAQKLRLDYIELTERDVDRDVVGLVPERVLRKHRAMPLRTDHGRRLVVAMIDPTDIYALEDLRMISGLPIVPVVATEEDIRRTQAKIFAVGEEVTKILEDAVEAGIEDYTDLDLGVEAGPDEKPIIRLVSSILQQAVGDGASDIHIEPQSQELTVRFRVDGVLRQVMSIPPKLQSGVLARLKILGNLNIAERRVPQDGRFSVKMSRQKIDLRVASLPAVYGEKIVLRLLDTTSVEVDLKKLGFSPRALDLYEEIYRRPYGTILVTGPTGSGKSTTLYATLDELNTPDKNIITVEDPVEYRMQNVTQMQVNARAGLNFASALKSILRADPDVVMIGEIRDFETAKIAVEAALTGHLVLATLHTNDAPGALSRLNDMGVEPFLTSSAVDCVIAQRLARKLCERCKEPVEIEEEILAGMRFPFEMVLEGGLRFHKAAGCNRCGGTGYRGRVGIFELMAVTDDIRALIVQRASNAEIGRIAEEEGMIRLRDDGLLKAAQGVTTIEEVLRTVV